MRKRASRDSSTVAHEQLGRPFDEDRLMRLLNAGQRRLPKALNQRVDLTAAAEEEDFVLIPCVSFGVGLQVRSEGGAYRVAMRLELTFQKAMRDDGTSQQQESFMRGVTCFFTHPQLSELMQP